MPGRLNRVVRLFRGQQTRRFFQLAEAGVRSPSAAACSTGWDGDTMKLGRLNHVGIATPSIAKSIAFYRDVMGAGVIREPFDLPAQGVKVCFVDTPNSQDRAHRAAGRGVADPRLSSRRTAGGAASSLLRGARYPRSQGVVRERWVQGARRAAHRRAWTMIFFVPPEGHGRRAHRDHGDSAWRALRIGPRSPRRK